MRRQKLHIYYEIHLDSPKGRFWLFFLVRYLIMNLGRDFRLNPPIKLVVYKFGEIFELIPLPVEKIHPCTELKFYEHFDDFSKKSTFGSLEFIIAFLEHALGENFNF